MERVRSNRRQGVPQHWRKRPLAKRLNIDTTTLDRWRREGRFPPGKTVSPQVVIWSEDEVLDWLREHGGEDG